MVYVQLWNGAKIGQNAMMLVCPQYIEYEITDVSLVFIDEFRAWKVDTTEYSFLPEGKLLKRIDRLRLTLSVAFGTYWRREERRRPQINRSVGCCTWVGWKLCWEVSRTGCQFTRHWRQGKWRVGIVDQKVTAAMTVSGPRNAHHAI